MNEAVKWLQDEAAQFLVKYELKLKDVIIQPKEIEMYFFKKGVFEDNSVHRNELQQNNRNHFYIHRNGIKQTDSYKGGNRPGLDFIVSDESFTFYSYLLRSAVVNGKMIIGPNKVLEAIKSASRLSMQEIEATPIEIISNAKSCPVLFSSRIHLGKSVLDNYRNYKLRAVACDDSFRGAKYPGKEKMIVDFILEKKLTGDQAIEFAKEKLDYIPSILRQE